jgi:diguanylate cyclase (GGDEF)-like protein
MENNAEHNNTTAILLVDDKIENLIALEKTLAPLKLKIIKATSGNEALKQMLSHDFSVVLLDVMMPDMDGFEVANLMHNNEKTKHIPIIFVTAINKSEQHMIHGMETGAVDYLYKPIDPVVLLSKIRVFVDLYNLKIKLEDSIKKLNDYQDLLEKSNEKLKQLSEEDPLTKIPNRRYFEERSERILELAKLNHFTSALIFIDLDNFKMINDQYGHEAGDSLLRLTAIILKNVLSAKDIVLFHSEIDTLARMGGDEFIVVVGNIVKAENVTVIIERILKAVEKTTFTYKGDDITFTVSIGAACFPDSGNTLSELMRAADKAMYSAKLAKKNS